MGDVPRSRAELEAIIEKERATWAPRLARYNLLLERSARTEAELERLRPVIEGRGVFDLEWEYFQRLQLDGVLPTLPRVVVPANRNHKNDGAEELLEETEKDGWHEPDFEIGSKGQEDR